MRSLFRLSEFIKLDSPKILIDTERNILNKRIKKLSADDLLFIVSEYPDFFIKQIKEAEVDKINIQNSFEDYIKTIN